MPFKKSDIPVLLFPLKIESRFIGDQLWIRIFPDEAFLQSHNPALSKNEREDARHFKNLSAADQKLYWENLVSKYGAYRSAWLVQISEDELKNQEKNSSSFDEQANAEQKFYFRGLPEQFKVYLYPSLDVRPLTVEFDAVQNFDELVVFGDGDDWVTDFEIARQEGMAVIVEKGDLEGYTFFERVIVVGFYDTSEVEKFEFKSANDLMALLNNHLYTEGLSFLDYGTPTNNLGNTKSGFSIKDEFDPIATYDSMAIGNDLLDDNNNNAFSSNATKTVGLKLAEGLGLEKNAFKFYKNANQKEPLFNYLLQKLSWFALGGETLKMIFGDLITSAAHEKIWNHFSEYTKQRGPYPAIKIGDQPYGILPVTQVRDILSDENKTDILDGSLDNPILMKTYLVLSLLFEKWAEMVKNSTGNRVPRLEDAVEVHTELHKVLSMQPSSSSFQVRTTGYDKIKGKIPHWLEVAANTPAALGTLPVAQVYDILKGHPEPEVASKYQPITAEAQKIISLFDGFITEQKEKDVLNYAPLFSFSNKGETQLDDLNLPITIQNIDALEVLFNEIEKDAKELKGNNSDKIRTKILQFKGETSLFSDLIINGYASAVELYNQTVYLTPTNEDLVGYKHLKIGIIKNEAGSQASSNKVVLEIYASKTDELKAERKIKIKVPFAGRIEKVYGKVGDDVRPGQPLFRIVNNAAHARIVKQFAHLGKALIAEWKNFSEKERETLQRTAIHEVMDLSSFRLDAWMTSLASARLEELRKKDPKGIYFGAYGWSENLIKDKEKTAKKKNGKYYDESRIGDGGIIHCPTPAQSLAATIFKNSFMSHEDSTESSNPFTLNLTSDRIQKANQLMEGIRQDQPIEALLGYRMERLLHEKKLHSVIYDLREAFPLEVNIVNRDDNNEDIGFKTLSVINGLEVIRNKENLGINLNGNASKVKQCIDHLSDVLDGSLDNLFFEAGYQLTQGNLTQSAAAIDATKGVLEPPETEALKTKIAGVGISHKLVYLFSSPKELYEETNCKAFVEPVLENWVEKHIGSLKKIGCKVDLSKDDAVFLTVDVKLSDLKIGYLDFLYLSDTQASDGASELELRIWKYVQSKNNNLDDTVSYRITDVAPNNCQSLSDAIEVAQYAYKLLSNNRYAKSDDLATNEENPIHDLDELKNINDGRLKPLLKNLKSWKKKLPQNLSHLAKLNLAEAKHAFLSGESIDVENLTRELNDMIAKLEQAIKDFKELLNSETEHYQLFDILEKASKVVFGKSFILLPPIFASEKMDAVIKAKKQDRLIGNSSFGTGKNWGQERVQTWIQELAQVKTDFEVFEEWQLTNCTWSEALKINDKSLFQVVQYPTFDSYPWVGLSKDEIEKLVNDKAGIYKNVSVYQDVDSGQSYPIDKKQYYPDGCESIVLFSDDSLKLFANGKPVSQYGIVIGEFAEHIPDEKIDTGLSFHYNGPNNEAPQVLLLAVPSPLRDKSIWSGDLIQEIVFDTMDLLKIRMVDLEAIDSTDSTSNKEKQYEHILPMTNWFNVPIIK